MQQTTAIVRLSYDQTAVFPLVKPRSCLNREIPLYYDMNVEVKFSGEPARGHTMGTPEVPPNWGSHTSTPKGGC